MTAIEEAVTKSKKIVDSANIIKIITAKYYEFALPWIFNEYLGFLRGEIKNKPNHNFLNLNIKYFIYKKYLKLVHFSNSFKSGKYDIIFFGSYSAHYKIYKDLGPQLKDNALSYLHITDKIALYNEIKSEGDNVIFLNINLTSKLTNYVSSKITNNIDFESLIEETINSNDKYFQHLENILKKTFLKFSPKIVITANELLIEHRAAILVGKQLNIKSITLQHGLISSVSKNYRELIADLILVYGNSSKKILLDMGVAVEKIKVVGSLILNNKIPASKTIKTKKSNLNILVAMSGSGNSTSYNHHLSLIEAINEVANKLPNLNFNIKLHRKDNIELYKNITAKNIQIISENDLLNTNKEFIDLVNDNDAMFTTTSASMFDAFLLKKPVLGVDFKAEFKENEFYKEGLLIVSENMVDLERNLNILVENAEFFKPTVNKAQNYLQEYYNLGCKNGTPQEKTINHILNLVK